MKKHFWLIFIVISCAVLGCAAAIIPFATADHAQAHKSDLPSKSDEDEPFRLMNKKARAAKRGGLNEARDVADAVIDPYIKGSLIPGSDDTIAEVKDRLARAEVAYRERGAEGVGEERVVRVINALAVKFDAPAYAKTDRAEVRKHRLALLLIAPNLASLDRRPTAMSKGRDKGSFLGGLRPKMCSAPLK